MWVRICVSCMCKNVSACVPHIRMCEYIYVYVYTYKHRGLYNSRT